VLRSLVETGIHAYRSRGKPAGPPPAVPGPELRQTVPPRSADLVRDYVRHVGGDPAWYRKTLPPHLFPQWGFPLLAATLRDVRYDMTRILNAGCRMQLRAPLPAGEPLQLRALLADVDDNGERVILTERLVTGTAGAPEALICDIQALVPLPRKKDAPRRPGKEKPRVPEAARAVGEWRLAANAGLQFALLTGDFNPVHWIPPVARMSGFKSTILHGYATLARTIETLHHGLWSGRVDRLREIEVRFVRPLVLPARVAVFVDDQGGVFVGKAPGGPAFLTGTFVTTDRSKESGR